LAHFLLIDDFRAAREHRLSQFKAGTDHFICFCSAQSNYPGKKCTQAKQAGSACNNSNYKDNYQQAPGNLDVGLEALGELAAGVEGAEVAAVRQMTGALGPTVEGLPAGTAESLWGKRGACKAAGVYGRRDFFLKRVGGEGSGLDVLKFL